MEDESVGENHDRQLQHSAPSQSVPSPYADADSVAPTEQERREVRDQMQAADMSESMRSAEVAAQVIARYSNFLLDRDYVHLRRKPFACVRYYYCKS